MEIKVHKTYTYEIKLKEVGSLFIAHDPVGRDIHIVYNDLDGHCMSDMIIDGVGLQPLSELEQMFNKMWDAQMEVEENEIGEK